MNKKLLTLLAALLLCSCGEGVLNQIDEQKAKEAKSRLYITVLDNSDNKPIADAKLNLQSAGKIANTAATGIAVFEDISVGDHLLVIKKEEYATALVSPTVSEISVAEDGGRATQERYKLYSKTASIEGYVQYTDAKGQTKALTGLPVRVTFNGCNLAEKATDTVLTDSKGKFKFDKLPAVEDDCDYSIESMGAVIGTQTFNAKTFSFNSKPALKKGGKVNLGAIDEKNGVGLFTLVSYNREIANGAETTPVVFTFSENIAANQQGKVTVNSSVAYTVTIATNTVTIKPLTKWVEDFSVVFNDIKSESGKTYSTTPYIYVLPKDVSALKVEDLKLISGEDIYYSTPRAKITFKKIEDASYRYYLEEGGKVSEVWCSDKTLNIPDQTYIVKECPIALSDSNATRQPRIGDNTNKLFVQVVNAKYESSLKAELEVKETKPVAPELSSGRVYGPLIEKGKILDPYGVSGTGNEVSSTLDIDEITKALGSGTASEEFSGNIYFSRAMDITKPATTDVSCSAEPGTPSPCSRLTITTEWLNDQVLSVKVKVNAGTALAGYFSGSITIRGLKGKNDKVFNNGLLAPDPTDVITVNISGYIPSPCVLNPFAQPAGTCTELEIKDFCDDLETYNNTAQCRETFRSPCSEGILIGTSLCPDAYIFYEDFESGTLGQFTRGARDGFASSPNKWIVSTAPGGSGYSAHISNNGSSYTYDVNSESVEYLYARVNLSAETYDISFSWKGVGEANYDGMIVCLVPESSFSASPLNFNGCYTIGNNFNSGSFTYRIGASSYTNSSSWRDVTINKTVSSGGAYYLVFLWNSDYGYTDGQPPTAIDNIKIEKAAPAPPPPPSQYCYFSYWNECDLIDGYSATECIDWGGSVVNRQTCENNGATIYE